MNYKEYKEKLKIEYNEYKEKIKNKLNEFKIKQNKQLEKFKNKQINSKKKNKRKTRGGVLYNRLDHYVFIKSFLDIVIDNKYYENPANEDNINRSMKHVLENDTLLQVFFDDRYNEPTKRAIESIIDIDFSYLEETQKSNLKSHIQLVYMKLYNIGKNEIFDFLIALFEAKKQSEPKLTNEFLSSLNKKDTYRAFGLTKISKMVIIDDIKSGKYLTTKTIDSLIQNISEKTDVKKEDIYNLLNFIKQQEGFINYNPSTVYTPPERQREAPISPWLAAHASELIAAVGIPARPPARPPAAARPVYARPLLPPARQAPAEPRPAWLPAEARRPEAAVGRRQAPPAEGRRQAWENESGLLGLMNGLPPARQAPAALPPAARRPAAPAAPAAEPRPAWLPAEARRPEAAVGRKQAWGNESGLPGMMHGEPGARQALPKHSDRLAMDTTNMESAEPSLLDILRESGRSSINITCKAL